MAMEKMKKIRFEELDALRGIAALLVVVFHFTMGKKEAELGFFLGNTGVDLFFMISGFVILLSLEHVKKLGQFIINRISRLYPTYWASVTLVFIVILLNGLYNSDFEKVSVVQYLGNLTMFQFYLRIPNLDGPYWSLIIELLFYSVMAVLYHFKCLKFLNWIGVVLTLFTVCILYFSYDALWVQRIFFSYFPLIQYWPLFFSGILFYQLITKKIQLAKHYVLIVFCLIAQVILFEYSGRSGSFIVVEEYVFMLIVYFSLFTLFVNGKLKFIISKPLLFLGKISFALYLIHQMISIEYIIPYLYDELKLNFWISFLAALITSIGLATFITYFVEIPFSKKLKNKLYKTFYKQ